MNAEIFTGAAAEWNAFVASCGNATAAHAFAWKAVIESAYRHECPYLVVRRDGNIVGALPLVSVRSQAFGHFLVSMPFMSTGGPLGDESAVRELENAAIELARRRGAQMVELRCLDQMPTELPASTDKIVCEIDLPETAEQLWSAFPSKLRAQVRRPQKEGLTVRFGESEVLPFFSVFAHNMRDLGSPTHSLSFFRALQREMSSHVEFGCVYHGDAPIAAGCAVRWRDEVEMTWASALREYSASAPNMLLYWSFMERNINAGAKRFSFGRCTPDTGSHRFKKQWGTTDSPLYWYQWSASGHGSLPGTQSRSMAIATRLWQKMPLPIATLIGPYLRKGIPA